MENTLVILKPDGVNKKLLRLVIERFQKSGLFVSNLKAMELNKEILAKHYSHLLEKPFYAHLEEFMLSSVVVVMIVSGENAVAKVRDIIGATDPKKADINSIRGMYGNKEDVSHNIVHASDSKENALIEIMRFYQEENEIIDKNNFVYQKRR